MRRLTGIAHSRLASPDWLAHHAASHHHLHFFRLVSFFSLLCAFNKTILAGYSSNKMFDKVGAIRTVQLEKARAIRPSHGFFSSCYPRCCCFCTSVLCTFNYAAGVRTRVTHKRTICIRKCGPSRRYRAYI